MRRFSFFCMLLPIFLAQLALSPAFASASSSPQAASLPGDIRFKNLSIGDGLSQSSVRSLLQDRQGFLWLGTEDGLNRYDGYTFKIYRPIPNDPSSLSDRWITSIYEDTDGYLWLGTRQGGLNKYDPRTDQFTHYRASPGDASGLASDYVECIAQDASGNIWVGTADGLDRLEPKTGKVQHYHHAANDPNSLSGNTITTLLVDPKGTLWVGTHMSGLNQLDPSTNTFRHYRQDAAVATSLNSDSILSIQPASNGDIWVAADTGLNRLNPQTGLAQRYTLPTDPSSSQAAPKISNIYVDRHNILWIGTDQGLNRFDEHTGKFINYHHIPALPDTLNNNFILSMVEDREGVLWVGTYGGGVDKYNQAQDKFKYFRHDPENPDSLISDYVFNFHVDPSGVTWIATLEGLDRLDPATGRFAHFRHDAGLSTSLSDNFVWYVLRDSQGKLWVGTRSGLDQLNEATNQFVHYQHDPQNPDSLIDDHVYSLYEDKSNQLWLGTSGGLDRFDRQTGKFIHYSDPNGPSGLMKDAVDTMIEDGNGNLWVGTFNSGLYRLDPDRKKFTYYQNNPKKPGSGLSNNTILAFLQTQDGSLWIATTNGLNQLDPGSGTFNVYTEQNGLPNDVVYSLIEDQQGFLWMSTNFGISRFDPRTKVFRNYTANDGLQGNEFNQAAAAQAPDGAIYFGGINGFNIFYPQQLQDNPYIPPVALTALTVNGKPLSPQAAQASIPALDAITLQWPQDSFEFDFSALSFSEPQNNQYAYKLDKFDSDWNKIGDKHNGRYTNLPGGAYTLLLKASNGDGVWNETGKSIRVTVIAPFWKTGWFYGLLGLALLGCVAVIYRLRVSSIELQKLELERLVSKRTQEIEQLFEQNKELAVIEERNRLARDLHDSAKQKAFASLAQLGAASSLMNQDLSSAQKHLGEAENLVYEVIQELTFLIQEMYPIALMEKGLANTLREYAFEWETRTAIRVNLHIESEGHLPLESEQAVYRIVQESLANIARHSRAGSVEFSVIYHPENIVVCITDNGQGFDPQQKPNGIGLRSMQERAKSVGGTFEVSSTPGQGTQIKIMVPALRPEKVNGGHNG